ncbi:MAG TPA: GNAT family N-acetyltransferase [Actinomycetota bacterium]|jgi:GNAT superfamily N-acetyltransferase|nr:GNAT family N-acetyltransferase [Actinomycetota bacterium]
MQDVGERIALGFVEAERQRRANVPDSEVVEIDGLFLVFANVADPEVNSTLVISEPDHPSTAVAKAETAFGERDRVFGMDLAVGRHPSVDEAVRSAGLSLLFSWPAMAARIDDIPERSQPEGIRVEAVTDERGASAVARVERSLIDPSELTDGPGIAERFYGPGSYGVENARAFIAWEGDEPVGVASAHLRAGAVGILGVGVIPRARRRGIASALSVTAARTFPADLAWLHAAEGAQGVYAQLGFREVAEWEVWVRVPTAD